MSYCKQSLVRQGTQAIIGDTSGNPTTPQVSYFLYATQDAAATVETAGYFNNARGLLAVGDLISAVMATGATPVRKGYVVTAVPAAGSNVTIALGTTTAG